MHVLRSESNPQAGINMACPWCETALAFRTIKFTSNHYWILYSFFLHRNSFLAGNSECACIAKRERCCLGVCSAGLATGIYLCAGAGGEKRSISIHCIVCVFVIFGGMGESRTGILCFGKISLLLPALISGQA